MAKFVKSNRKGAAMDSMEKGASNDGGKRIMHTATMTLYLQDPGDSFQKKTMF